MLKTVSILLDKYSEDIKSTFKLSMPIIFGRLGAVLMGVLDTMMIGRIGYNSLAASGIANSIFILVAIIPIGMMIVGSPMISSEHSKNNKLECVNILKSCIQVSIIISLFFILILFLLSFNFHFFGQTKEVETLAVPFLMILNFSIIPLMFFIAVEQFSDGLENTQISMFFNTTALFVNAGINWILIYGNWGFPAMGLTGAGIGTFIARVYMAVGIWCVVMYMGKFKEYNLKFNVFTIHAQSFYKVLKQGIPSGLQFFFEVSAFSVSAIIIGWLGAVPLAAHNIALSLASITYMVSSGFATGGSIRVGQAFGIKDRIGILRAGKSSLFLVSILMGITCLAFIILNVPLVKLFTNEELVIPIACNLLLLAGIFQLSDGIQVVAIRSLLGMEDVNIPAIITLVSYWVIGIPLGCLFTFVFNMNVYGIWIGLVIGLTLASILLCFRFFTKANEI